MQEKSLSEINERIRDGSARVVTAEEMPDIVDELGPAGAVREVDVVTTGTFGAMCSSGVFLNLGHSDPPIKISRALLNRVEAYGGVAAVDLFLGATQPSEDRGIEYGGAHVMEDLISGKQIEVEAFGAGTDCYPQMELETSLRLEDFNQAIMVNPRNAYQRYNAATNSSDRTVHTYMGTLLPRLGNIHYSGAGILSPISNDPNFDYIGVGTRIFLAGAQGFVMGGGTQHNPENNFSTLMVTGDMKKMSSRFLRAATFHKYGPSLYLGIGIPIPVLNERLAKSTAVRDRDISVPVVDYGIPRRDRPSLKMVSYEDLKSGIIDLNGKEVSTSSLSSFLMAREVAADPQGAGGEGRVPAQRCCGAAAEIGQLAAHEADQGVAQCGGCHEPGCGQRGRGHRGGGGGQADCERPVRSSACGLPGWQADGNHHRLGYLQGRGRRKALSHWRDHDQTGLLGTVR